MTEKEIIQKIYEVIKLVDCMQYNPFVDFNYLRAKGAYNVIKNQVEHIEAENTELRARLEKAVDKTIVSEMLAKYFDCPCNFSPLDEEMWAYCRDNCVDDNIECWIRVINKKCAELKGEKK